MSASGRCPGPHTPQSSTIKYGQGRVGQGSGVLGLKRRGRWPEGGVAERIVPHHSPPLVISLPLQTHAHTLSDVRVHQWVREGPISEWGPIS